MSGWSDNGNDYDIDIEQYSEEWRDTSDYSTSSEDGWTFRHDRRHIEKTPSIPTKVPALKDISSVAVAIALWNHKNFPDFVSPKRESTKKSKEWRSFVDDVRQSLTELPVPTSIVNYIETYVFKMEKEICDWARYHLRAIFFQDENDYILYYHIYNLVWHPNGAINYKETARNLLSSVRLSDMEKFRFLATYCLKDEMEKMSKSLFSNRNKDNVPIDEFPLICYWNWYFRNELNLTSAPEILPSNLRMALHRKVNNWQSKAYFFDLLSPEEQVKCAKALIVEYKIKYQKLVLMKLNETQRIHVYLETATDIMNNYARSKDSDIDDILPTWLEIRDLITEDRFVTIFMNFTNLKSDHILKEIWIETPCDLKRHALNYNDHQIIKNAFSFAKFHYGEFKLDLLFAMLSDADVSLKRKIAKQEYMGDLCENFLEMRQTECLDRLLRLCFPEIEELVNFKQNLVFNSHSVRSQCEFFYINGNVKQINTYLHSLMTKPEAISEYKKNLLMSEIGIEACSNLVFPLKKRDKLRTIISDGLPTQDLATEFTKKILFSKNTVYELRRSVRKDGVDRVQECIDYYLESTEDKRTLKKRIIRDEILLCELLMRYDKSQWKNFIRWALEYDQAIENFKRELDLDYVFDRVLKYCLFKTFDPDRLWWKCRLQRLRHVKFDPLDVFLKWYFGSSANVDSYKRRRIDSWMDIESIETLLKFDSKKNKKYFKVLMRWFFGNDSKQIVKFKNKLKGDWM